MKALTLRQPWAFWVVDGQKKIENRKWNTSHRGKFLIHAAKNMTHKEFGEAWEFAKNFTSDTMPPYYEDLIFGGIIGSACIVDVIPPTPHPIVPWHMPDQYGFILENIQRLPFYPCKGKLNFWNFDCPAELANYYL